MLTHAPPMLRLLPLLLLGWMGACEIRCEGIRPDRSPLPAVETAPDGGVERSDGGEDGSSDDGGDGGATDGGDGGEGTDMGDMGQGMPHEAAPLDPRKGLPS